MKFPNDSTTVTISEDQSFRGTAAASKLDGEALPSKWFFIDNDIKIIWIGNPPIDKGNVIFFREHNITVFSKNPIYC